MSDRPNILFIQSDQHRYDCVGVNGHPLLQTPYMDQIAAEGMNFTQTYCPTPICVPTRTSLLNGQWPTSHLCIGNWDSEASRPAIEGLPTFSETLQRAGYRMGYVGKWHVHREKGPEAFGFDEYVNDWHYRAWREEQGIPPQPTGNKWFGELDPHITPEQSRLAWSVDHVIRMLQEHRDGPFFIRWDPNEPHPAYRLPEPYHSMYPPETIAPWSSFPDPLEGKPYCQGQQRRTWKVDTWTWEDWAPVVSRYLGLISLLDTQIGRVLAALDELGLRDNTLVIYTSDHGDMAGGHGMFDKHFIMYDDVVRVPFMARWPGHIEPGSVCEAFVSNSIDLGPTFCEVAGLPIPDTFAGQSLIPLFEGATDNGRQDIYAMFQGNQFGLYTQRMVRDRRWKYVWNATAEDELYDLQNDPGEVRNLATVSAHAEELSRLRRRMVAWMEAIDDPILNLWIRPQLLENLKI